MKKLNLFGMKKDGERLEIIIEKSQTFIPIIQKIVKELAKDRSWFFKTEDKKTSDAIDEKIRDCTDKCEYRKYKDYEMDIFVGKKRIILVIRTSVKNQEKFLDSLMKFYKWKK
jgi:hypothetical protein